MKNKRKQSGFILLFAVSMIPLVGIGIWVVTQHSRYLIQETGYEKLRAEARNMAFSVQEWAQLRRAQILSAPPGQTWTPDLTELQISRGCCQVKVISESPSACTLAITAVAESGTKSWTEKRTMVVFRQ